MLLRVCVSVGAVVCCGALTAVVCDPCSEKTEPKTLNICSWKFWNILFKSFLVTLLSSFARGPEVL